MNRSLLAGFILMLISCSQKPVQKPGSSEKIFSSKYEDINNWAAHPWKADPSDRKPDALKNENTDTVADVFFIYPTTYLKSKTTGINASLEDEALNKKTDRTTILYQSSVFNQHCRIFAPRYRQAHYSIFLDFESSKSKTALDTAYADVREAFIYYLKNYHNNRPFIIAAHSQGTIHAARLIKEFIDGKPLMNNFVCAYLLGMPAPVDYFTSIPGCRDSSQTKCFVSWRTFKRGYIPAYVLKEKEKLVVVNPLTWRTDDAFAPASLNKGGVLKNFNKITRHVVDAEVHGHVLWTSLPKFFGNIFLPTKNYHIADINLFYMNIRENVELRLREMNSGSQASPSK